MPGTPTGRARLVTLRNARPTPRPEQEGSFVNADARRIGLLPPTAPSHTSTVHFQAVQIQE